MKSSNSKDMLFFLSVPNEEFFYASSGNPNTKRLCHGSSQQKERFALYFGNETKIGEQPFMLEVTISDLNVEPNPTKVEAHLVDLKFIEYRVPENAVNIPYHQKICDILNAHPVWNSIIP